MTQANEHVRIFDTTLRDGEQSPGATMTTSEKLEVARALSRLGVDIIEAGFPAASPDDLLAVKTIAEEIGAGDGGTGRSAPPTICGLARACTARHRPGPRGRGAGRHPTGPHLHRHLPHPPRAQAADERGTGVGEGADDGRLRARALRRCRVQPRRRGPDRVRLPLPGGRDGNRGRRRDHQHPGHRRLHDAVGVRADDRRSQGTGTRHRKRDPLGPLPQRPRHGHRQHPRRV